MTSHQKKKRGNVETAFAANREKVEYMKYQFLLIEFAISKSSNHFDIKAEINEEKSGIVDRIIGNVINYIVFEIK